MKRTVNELSSDEECEPRKYTSTYEPSHSPLNKQVASALLTNGYVVVCVMNNDQLATVRSGLLSDMATYKDVTPGNTKPLVLGSFGALGNAASFHSPAVRNLRKVIHGVGFPYMAETAQSLYDRDGDEFNVSQVIDRLRVIQPKSVTNKETWHRDISPFSDDMVFGGWVNLDFSDQYFSCVPGTHNDPLFVARKGFSKEKHTETLTSGGVRLVNGKPVQKVTIPPGCMLIFSERILHEICKSKTDITSMRLHTAWCLTKGDSPLIPKLDQILKRQKPVTVKSGQHPPVFAQLHAVNWPEKLKNLEGVYDFPYLLYSYKSGKASINHPNGILIPHPLNKPMPSLAALSGFHKTDRMYAPYTDEEIALYYPQRVVNKEKAAKRAKSQ